MEVEQETKITQLNRMSEVIDRNARNWQRETETAKRKTEAHPYLLRHSASFQHTHTHTHTHTHRL